MPLVPGSSSGSREGPGSWLAPLLLAAGVVLFFHPLLLGEGVLYFRDISLNHYPTRVYTTPILRSGHLPLWNPYLAGGMPLAANPNNLIFHPITLLFLVLPVGLAFPASILLQVFLSGWGLYLWAREIGLNEKAALGGGIIYAFSGGIASCGTFHNLLSSWAWAPLALFAFARHLHTGSRKALAGAGAALAVTLIAGDPLAAGTVIFLGILEACAGETPAPVPRGRRLAAPVSLLVIGIGLALIQILPARELLSASSRGEGIRYADASEWALPGGRLLEWVVPSLYGDVTAIRPTSYWGGPIFEMGYQFLLTVYFGVIPLLLALVALVGRPRHRAPALWIATLMAVAVALGNATPLYSFLYRHAPLVANLRYPSRFLLPTFLFLSLLSAMGLHRLLGPQADPRPEMAPRIFGGASILLAGLAAVAALSSTLRLRLLTEGLGIPPSLGSEVLAAASGRLQMGFARCALLAAAGGVLAAVFRRKWIGAAAFTGLLLGTAGLDLIAANFHTNPVAPRSFLREKPPVLDNLDPEDPAPRVFSEKRPPNLAVWAKEDSARWGYLWNHLTLRVCTGLPHRVPQAFQPSIDLLSPRLANDLAQSMPGLEPEKVRRLCELASVGLLMTYRDLPDPGLSLEGTVSGRTNIPLRIYRNRDALARAYLVSGARPERGDPLEALTDAAFDPRAEVYLAGADAISGARGAAGEARVVEDLPEHLVVALRADREAWLVLTDNHYPGWFARVDGAQAPIRRANFLFRAVRVGPGEHRVVFEYRPRSLFEGAAGSAITLAALGLWTFFPRRNGPTVP